MLQLRALGQLNDLVDTAFCPLDYQVQVSLYRDRVIRTAVGLRTQRHFIVNFAFGHPNRSRRHELAAVPLNEEEPHVHPGGIPLQTPAQNQRPLAPV